MFEIVHRFIILIKIQWQLMTLGLHLISEISYNMSFEAATKRYIWYRIKRTLKKTEKYVTSTIKKAKTEYYCLSENINDLKYAWNCTNQVINKNEE